MRIGTYVTLSSFEEELADPYRTRKFDQITSRCRKAAAAAVQWYERYYTLLTRQNEFRRASEWTSRIDFIKCHSSIRLIDGNAVKRATSRLLARQVGLMAHLVRVLDSLATIRNVPPSVLSLILLSLLYPPLLFAPRRCPLCRAGEFAILIKQVHS